MQEMKHLIILRLERRKGQVPHIHTTPKTETHTPPSARAAATSFWVE